MRGLEKPAQLRLWGFILTVAGGGTIALGSLLSWVSVGNRGDTEGILTSTSPGVDFRAGKVALALGVLVLVAILALRITHSTKLRRAIAVGVIAMGLAGAAIGIYEMSRDDRFLFSGVRPRAQYYNQEIGLPKNEQLIVKIRQQLQKDGYVDVKIGLPLMVAGGAIAVFGGLLDFAWAGARRREREAEQGA